MATEWTEKEKKLLFENNWDPYYDGKASYNLEMGHLLTKNADESITYRKGEDKAVKFKTLKEAFKIK